MTERRRLRKAHHYYEPALTITTSASPEASLDTLVAGLVAAKADLVRRDHGSATLQLGSFLRSWIFSDTMLLDVVRPLRTWGMRATVDLRVLDVAPPTQVRVALTKVDQYRETVPYVLAAVDVAAQVLRDRDFVTEVGEVEHGP